MHDVRADGWKFALNVSTKTFSVSRRQSSLHNKYLYTCTPVHQARHGEAFLSKIRHELHVVNILLDCMFLYDSTRNYRCCVPTVAKRHPHTAGTKRYECILTRIYMYLYYLRHPSVGIPFTQHPVSVCREAQQHIIHAKEEAACPRVFYNPIREEELWCCGVSLHDRGTTSPFRQGSLTMLCTCTPPSMDDRS